MQTTIIIIGTLLIVLAVAYAWLGGFRRIKFTLQEAGGETLIYESHTGDYKNVGKVIEKMYYALLVLLVKQILHGACPERSEWVQDDKTITNRSS